MVGFALQEYAEIFALNSTGCSSIELLGAACHHGHINRIVGFHLLSDYRQLWIDLNLND